MTAPKREDKADGRVIEFVGAQGVGKSTIRNLVAPHTALDSQTLRRNYRVGAKLQRFVIFILLLWAVIPRVIRDFRLVQPLLRLASSSITISQARNDGHLIVLDEGVIRRIAALKQIQAITCEQAIRLLRVFEKKSVLPDVVVYLHAPVDEITKRLLGRSMPERTVDSLPPEEMAASINRIIRALNCLSRHLESSPKTQVLYVDATRSFGEIIEDLMKREVFLRTESKRHIDGL